MPGHLDFTYWTQKLLVWNQNFFSRDENPNIFPWWKNVSCDLRCENFLRVMKSYTVFRVNERMRKIIIF